MGFLDDTYFGDLANETLQSLGISNGKDAANTIGSVVKDAKKSSASVTEAAASSSTPTFSVPSGTIFGMDKKQALIIAAVAVVGFVLIRRLKK